MQTAPGLPTPGSLARFAPCLNNQTVRNWPANLSGLFDQPGQPNQNHRSYKCHHDATDRPAGVNPHHSKQPSAKNPSQDSQDDVHYYPVSSAFHHLARQESGDQSDDEPPKQSTHVILLFSYLRSVRLRMLLEDSLAKRQEIGRAHV